MEITDETGFAYRNYMLIILKGVMRLWFFWFWLTIAFGVPNLVQVVVFDHFQGVWCSYGSDLYSFCFSFQALTSTAVKKGGLSTGDVAAQYKHKNSTIDVKFDTESNVGCFVC